MEVRMRNRSSIAAFLEPKRTIAGLSRYIVLAVMCVMVLLTASHADAKRRVIDTDDDNNVITRDLEGYCDFNGEECNSPIPLGYSVDFGAGAVDSFIVYGNGLFSFGDTPVNIADIFNFDGSLAFFNASVIAPGLNSYTDFSNLDGDEVFSQSAEFSFKPNNGLFVHWFECVSTFNCSSHYSMTLTPGATGLLVEFDYDDFPFTPISGYSIKGVGTVENTLGDSFIIPATFSTTPPVDHSVPEPGNWALMIIGFGFVGAALRRARRHAFAPVFAAMR